MEDIITMSWMTPYKDYIEKHSKLLLDHNFTFFGENDTSMQYKDDDIFVAFSVERYSDYLTVWIGYTRDADQNEYRLDIIMTIFYQKDLTPSFAVESEEDMDRLVKNYAQFIIDNKSELFGATFPLVKEYDEYNQT